MADSTHQKVEELLAKVYELYSDYVLKNPFYSVDMPIRWEHCDWLGAVVLLVVVLGRFIEKQNSTHNYCAALSSILAAKKPLTINFKMPF